MIAKLTTFATFCLITALVSSLGRVAYAQSQGNLESVTQDFVSGWACASNNGRSRWVHLFDGATYIGSTTSNRVRRDDAASLCQGQNYVGFQTAVRLGDGAHSIKAYTNDSPSATLTHQVGSTVNINFGGITAQPPKPFGTVESTSSTTVAGWVCDNDAPSGPVQLQVFVQLDGHGNFHHVANGQTSINRYIPYCSNPVTGFNIALPPMSGGNHNIVVRAINVGPGADNFLPKYPTVPTLTPFPYEQSANLDSNFYQAPGCWTTPNAEYANSSGCNLLDFIWTMSVSRTINTAALPEPQFGYSGPASRIRYDGLSPNGMVFKINTYDSSSNLYPWDYHFQAMETRTPGTYLADVNSVKTEFRFRIRDDFFFYDSSLTGPLPGIETGNVPWVHLAISGVFLDLSTGITYFIEVVPFSRKGSGGSLLGTIGGPPEALNARLLITDSRLANVVSLPSTMLLGEQRTIRINFKDAFSAVFPSVNIDNVLFTGSYIGTEQYGRNKIALDLQRLSVQYY